MRLNVYAEELTDRVEIISKEIEGRTYTALRFYLELPTTVLLCPPGVGSETGNFVPYANDADDCSGCHFVKSAHRAVNIAGPFIHRPGDDDSSAVTFWGKQDLRVLLRKALAMLDEHYAKPKA